LQISKISSKNSTFERISKAFAPLTKRAYFVGGCVRDSLLGLEIKDFDIEFYDIDEKLFEKTCEKLGAQGFGKSFFVYKLNEFDLSLARRENKIAKGHKGFEVFICNDEKEAAKRRDFTINSMMVNIFSGEFLDLYGGKKDLKARILRHIDEKSFKEDSLRVLRAVQFVARFRLKIAPETLTLMKSIEIDDLSKDRINGELYKFFNAKYLTLGFRALQDLNLEERIFFFNAKKDNKKNQSFQRLLNKALKFIKDEGLFLYLYLNFFNIDKKEFFKKTGLKKELLTKAKQEFHQGKMSSLTLLKISLIMPLNQWLGLYSKARIERAKKLHIFNQKFECKISTQKLIKKGFKGKALGDEINLLKLEALKKYLAKKAF